MSKQYTCWWLENHISAAPTLQVNDLTFSTLKMVKLLLVYINTERCHEQAGLDREHTRSARWVQLDQLTGQWSVPWQLLFKCNAERIRHHQWLLMLLPCIVQLQTTATQDAACTMTRNTVDQKLRRPLGSPRTMWMKTIQEDPESNNLSVNEAIYVAQNCTFWRRLRLALSMVHARNELWLVFIAFWSINHYN